MKLRGLNSRRQIKELLDDFSQLPPSAIACETFICLLGSSLNHRACALFELHPISIPRPHQARLAVLGGAAQAEPRGEAAPGVRGCSEHCCALGRSPLGGQST